MVDPILTTASFCSGVGLLDEGVRAGCEFLGYRAQPALLCEWDAYAAAVLLARMEDEGLEPAPIWCGDLRDFDGKPFRGLVDIATAGLPCQPYSSAGKQRGNRDHRSFGDGDGPLPQFLRIVREIEPAMVFLENVPAWVCGGWFRPFGEELSGLGYTLESPLFVTAESVGASHRRERVFILAHCAESRGWLVPESNRWHDAADAHGSKQAMAHARRDSSEARQRRIQRKTTHAKERSTEDSQLRRAAMGNAQRSRSQGRGLAVTYRRDFAGPPDADRGIFAPGPTADWRDIPQHLWPAIEPGFRVLVDGQPVVVDASRADQLRCAGNGCVPLAAAVAFVELINRIA